MDNIKKVIIFIPAYNEEEMIGKVIDMVHETYPPAMTKAKGYLVEILVVNDGSRDKTEEIARQKGAEVYVHITNRGLGAATRSGMEEAYAMGADVAIKLDADLQHDPMDIEKTIMPILEDRTDICWGSRIAGEITYKMPLIRFVGNKFFTWLMNRMTTYEISDAQTGLMAFNRKYLAVFQIMGNYNPPQQLLVDAHNKNMRYHEVPVVFNARMTGKSFVSLRYPFFVVVNVFRMLLFANPLKMFSSVGFFLVFLAVLHSGVNILNQSYQWGLPSFFQDDGPRLALLIFGGQSFFFGVLADLIIKKK
jgi:glycosyltransferase involved in cell wall biosynthesis|tara:strand:- start:844 stop:1761 length:918 start_codon:yes stop_codon:yes gene_type:complete